MTCIVGLIDKDRTIWIGGDSAFDTSTGIIQSKNPKVYKKGEFIFGISGYLSVSHALTHTMAFPDCYEKQDPLTYIINNFIPDYRNALHQLGLIEMENGIERNRSEILVGYRGHLFSIGTDFSVLESLEDFFAVGSGSVYAMGALYATRYLKLEPKLRLELALESASMYDEAVCPPFEIESLESYDSFVDVDSIVNRANELMPKED
jgi:ATP-dependent protease HslVU (ClpYQ) peptidase subunit